MDPKARAPRRSTGISLVDIALEVSRQISAPMFDSI